MQRGARAPLRTLGVLRVLRVLAVLRMLGVLRVLAVPRALAVWLTASSRDVASAARAAFGGRESVASFAPLARFTGAWLVAPTVVAGALVALSLAIATRSAAQPVEAGDLPSPAVEAGDPPSPAVEALGPIDAARVQLRAEMWIDRVSAVYALQRMGADAAPATAALVRALSDEHERVRVEAAEALFRIGDPAVPGLITQVDSPHVETRLLAVYTLGRIGLGAASALPALHDAAARDADPGVRDAAAFAGAVIAPEGASGWLHKIGYEIGDEPYAIPMVLGAFVLLTALGSIRGLVQSWRRARAFPRAEHDDAGRGERMVARTEPRSGEVDHAAAYRDGDAHDDRDREPLDDDHVAAHDAGDLPVPAGIAPGGARRRSRRVVRTFTAPHGLTHAFAGMTAIMVGIGVALLATFAGDSTLEEQHGVYHFGALFVLFGYLFVKIGIKGTLDERRARARAATESEPWLIDRAWSRHGTGPIRAERVLPNLVALLIWIAFLTPFHTAWRLPFSWWGVWIVLGLFDLIALALVVAVARRTWRWLRSGRAFLRWQSVPVRPGGTFHARFETARRLGAEQRISATLRCLRDRTENPVSGDEPAADADEIYADAKQFQVHDRPEGGSWSQLSFTVPAKAQGTTSSGARPVRWVVTVALPGAGPDFRTTFPVPIYH